MDITTYWQAENAFDEYLNETSGVIKVAGIELTPSRALKETDPVGYRTAFNDWCDYEGIDTDELED